MTSPVLQQVLRQLVAGETLSAAAAAAAFDAVMSGEGSAAQMAALLMGLRVRGERASEVAGAARALRTAMTKLVADAPDSLVDTCGTGGGSVTTFNISTAAAILAAGAGVRVAKHGNRSFTSKSGSADVLEALGVPIDLPVNRMGEVLEEAGIVFMFAPTMHPAMRHVGPVRREMGIQTVMNLVGPLANPAMAGRQVIGVADPARLELIAGALLELGTVHSLVVHGAPGIDEVSPLGPTTILEIRDGAVRRSEFSLEQVGLAPAGQADLAGGEPAQNAAVVERVLLGKGPPGAEAAVVLNAGAAIYVAGKAEGLAAGVTLAREALKAGAGWDALGRLRRATASRR
ncbi:MAG: anthranilate phosphoribosyltransferase [Gemmatimonadaceae bacterium]|nr:anthranilate phosphoribosyltransferase [Gemmatimonadaceae bacterium]MCW5825260.1 anthranilate phosphoribosyltransferase [Gemmatimonadaceae bacterium]